jgi:hypothetical protein
VQFGPVTVATLPLRLALQAVTTAARVGASAVELVTRLVSPTRDDRRSAPVDGAAPAPPVPARPPRPRKPEAAAAPAPQPRPIPGAAATPSPEPSLVSEEPALVAQSADPGAEDGAGPEIDVAEPWPGYGAGRVAEVVARLARASAEEVAVAQLYENRHRRRRSVLAAAERRLKLLSSPARR